jgi:hypothetical protein
MSGERKAADFITLPMGCFSGNRRRIRDPVLGVAEVPADALAITGKQEAHTT